MAIYTKDNPKMQMPGSVCSLMTIEINKKIRYISKIHPTSIKYKVWLYVQKPELLSQAENTKKSNQKHVQNSIKNESYLTSFTWFLNPWLSLNFTPLSLRGYRC